jgi:thymidylate synthase
MQATHEYHKLLDNILKYGKKKTDRTGTGTTSIFDYKIKFDMAQGFPLITTKRLHTKSIIHELLWFLKGSTNTKYLKENGVTIWDEWADKNGDLGPIYGKQWRRWVTSGFNKQSILDKESGNFVIDQISNIINELKENPDSRRLMVSAWNVGELDQMALPPCHWAFELYTEELTLKERTEIYRDRQPGNNMKSEVDNWDYEHKFFDNQNIPKRRLHLKWHQRSVDTFLGLPFNIASYALLLHMFAQQTNMVPGTLVGDLTNVHIYDNHMEYVKKQLARPYQKHNAPTLTLNNELTIEDRIIIAKKSDKFELLDCISSDTCDIKGISKTNDIFNYKFSDVIIENYEYFPNWKNIPISV